MPQRKRRGSRNESRLLCHRFLVFVTIFLLVSLLSEGLAGLFSMSFNSATILKNYDQNWTRPSSRTKDNAWLPPSSFSLLPDPNTLDVNETLFPIRRVYARDAQDGITAILPVTEDSLNELESNIKSILSSRSSVLREIIVACHLRMAAKTEKATEKARVSFPKAVSITFLPWGQADIYSSGALHVLSSVLTSRVLLLGVTALNHLEEATRLILLDSIPSNSPIGPFGYLISPFNVSCIRSPERTSPVAYLVPPFLASTSLLMEAENGMRLDVSTWAALGDRLVKTRGAGFGGLVLAGGGISQYQCPDTMTAVAADPIVSSAFLRSFYHSLVNRINIKPSVPIRFNMLLPGRDELKSFSLTMCEMADRGYVLNVLLFSWEDATSSSHFALDLGCHLHFETLPQDSNTSSLLEQLKAWILTTDPDVLLYAPDGLTRTMVIEASVEDFRVTEGTVMIIPAADLPFCEWMAMLSLSDWQNWHKPRIDLSVITNDRPRSLSRLLDSLNAARYYGDTVHLKINLEQTADIETRWIAGRFIWQPGLVHLQHRVIFAGLLPSVVEAWYPHGNDSYGVLLEDDVEVSPLFYAWIKMAILRYRYGPFRSQAGSLFGVSLYQPRNLELRVEGRVAFDPRALFAEHDLPDLRTPYLSQVPCSWGAVYFPEHFREFHDYLVLRLSEATHNISETIVPDIRSNKWTRSWKKYFNELVYLRGYVMLYPNYDLSLATNHVEPGAHVKDVPEAVRKQYEILLMPLTSVSSGTRAVSLLDLPGDSLPSWDDLPVLDLWGYFTSHQELLLRGRRRHAILSGCSSRIADFTFDAVELICPHPI